MGAKEKYYNIVIDNLIKETTFYISNSKYGGLVCELAFPMDEHYTTYDISDLTTITFEVENDTDHQYLQERYGVNTEEETKILFNKYWNKVTKNIILEMKRQYPDNPEIKCLV